MGVGATTPLGVTRVGGRRLALPGRLASWYDPGKLRAGQAALLYGGHKRRQVKQDSDVDEMHSVWSDLSGPFGRRA